MPDDEPKSAYELAMERLREKDREEGRAGSVRLTDEQKQEIAEIRRVYEAKAAELEIMHRSNLLKAASLEEIEKLEANYRKDRQRLEEEREGRIKKVRRGAPA